MKAKVQNLKDNRDSVIKTLIALFGEENLKSNMRSLLNLVEEAEMFSTKDSIDECIDALEELSQTPRRKTTKTAELLAGLAEFELERN